MCGDKCVCLRVWVQMCNYRAKCFLIGPRRETELFRNGSLHSVSLSAASWAVLARTLWQGARPSVFAHRVVALFCSYALSEKLPFPPSPLLSRLSGIAASYAAAPTIESDSASVIITADDLSVKTAVSCGRYTRKRYWCVQTACADSFNLSLFPPLPSKEQCDQHCGHGKRRCRCRRHGQSSERRSRFRRNDGCKLLFENKRMLVASHVRCLEFRDLVAARHKQGAYFLSARL